MASKVPLQVLNSAIFSNTKLRKNVTIDLHFSETYGF